MVKKALARESSLNPDDSADSPLSSMASSIASDSEAPASPGAEPDSRPSKRQKIASGAATPTTVAAPDLPEPAAALPHPEADGMSEVSEDTDGDVPSSPPANVQRWWYEEEDFQEQVSTCAWDGCGAGELGNMDALVEHIHNEHIESRQKKYTCEWVGCPRKSLAHASGYALKAHMRSHTREKPFYCYLPECDRSFTRSDALAKHMRTVHETEALRPSDPISKLAQQPGGAGATPGPKSGKLKIIIKTQQSIATGHDDSIEDAGEANGHDNSDKEHFTPLPEDIFSERELAYPLHELHARCRIQLKLADGEGEKLAAEIRGEEEEYRRLWREKEALLAHVMKVEEDWHERRAAVASGAVEIQVAGGVEGTGGGEGGEGGESHANVVPQTNGAADEVLAGSAAE